MAQKYGLTNVVFGERVSRSEVARIVASCQACMTIIRPSRDNTWSPNKMFDALAAGKPVLTNVPGWLGEMIEKNGCGKCLDPYRPEMLADALEQLAAAPQLCQQMGKNARALAEREFDRNKLANRLETVLLRAVEATGA
jgi:glycosyltransferase involved in cell wall biosynthesis